MYVCMYVCMYVARGQAKGTINFVAVAASYWPLVPPELRRIWNMVIRTAAIDLSSAKLLVASSFTAF